MKRLEYTITIAASRKKVWDTMLQPETYKAWVATTWANSYYEGSWEQGENIRFLMPEQGGTMATIVENKPYETVLAKHVAIILPDGTEDYDSEGAKGWVGTLERYSFSEEGGKTSLVVTIDTYPAWENMFNDGWPKALEVLKGLCETTPQPVAQ